MNGNAQEFAFEKTLAEGLADVATELRLVNVLDLIAYVHADRGANLEDLVNSSAELYFKPGTLRYGWAADLDVRWDAVPTILLDMEFRHMAVTVFFKLLLNSARAAIDIQHIVFENEFDGPEEKSNQFIAAIANARLAPQAHGKDSGLGDHFAGL